MADKFKWMKERLKESRKASAISIQSPNGMVYEIAVDDKGVLKTKKAYKLGLSRL